MQYNVWFSYIGTFYRGLAKSSKAIEHTSIQGVLETALLKLIGGVKPSVYTTSRTDVGVHALQSNFLIKTEHDVECTPDQLTQSMNTYLNEHKHDIRILKMIEVPDWFHARKCVIRRSYVYRIGVAKMQRPSSTVQLMQYIPIAEKFRCFFTWQPFNEQLFAKAAETISGVHDFETFMCKTTDKKLTARHVDIRILEGRGLVNAHDPLYRHFDFFDVVVTSRSFLYKQVRKMVGAMVSAARGDITIDDIQWMLDNPHYQNWNSKAKLLTPCGLYLRTIEFHEKTFDKGFWEKWTEENFSKPVSAQVVVEEIQH